MKPKILFLLQDLLAGGAQRHTFNLAEEISDDFHPILMAHASGVSDSIVKDSQIPDIRFLNEKGLLNPFKLVKISQSVAKEKPNLLIAINQIATIIAIFGKITGIIRCPVVSIFHNTEIKNVAGWIRTIPYIVAVRFCEALVYISSNQQMIWNARRLSAKRNILIRNGINVSGFTIPTDIERRDARNELGFSPTDFVIGCLAALRYEKNHIQLIEALSQLRANGVPAKVLLVGDGPKRQEIESKVDQLGMAAYVLFAGERRDVRRFISAMDVGVLTSLSIETLSLAALETMAMGMPMVMSEIGGASEIITEGKEGYLFPAGDTVKLVEKLKLCAEPSHARLLGENAARKVRDEFQHQTMCDAYRNLFHELIAESKSKKLNLSR
jgi:glycosyltransferase involved in cell wall biosynthesis